MGDPPAAGGRKLDGGAAPPSSFQTAMATPGSASSFGVSGALTDHMQTAVATPGGSSFGVSGASSAQMQTAVATPGGGAVSTSTPAGIGAGSLGSFLISFISYSSNVHLRHIFASGSASFYCILILDASYCLERVTPLLVTMFRWS